MAARAHDVAALTIKGQSAFLNFPELASTLPRPATASPKDIQAAAAKAATSTFTQNRDHQLPAAVSGNAHNDDALFDLPDLLLFSSSSSSSSSSSWKKKWKKKKMMTMK
ncbi:hypothetical protein J5N97_029756 [Dioscorea zingiberensis]|uniref:AP2/ERF domain-containing protein n=1 Tax=Dioscorea zingiberensis TaxID=325984 RepID=A0A9D5BWG2_9LILI|nr:hypothetical protein J5N97_029756 [Dioscorea zingiberensis]